MEALQKMCFLENAMDCYFAWIKRSYPEAKENRKKEKKGSLLVVAVSVPNHINKNDILLRHKCHIGLGDDVVVQQGIFEKLIIKNGRKEEILYGGWTKIPYLRVRESISGKYLEFIAVKGKKSLQYYRYNL